jgi:hypothetical protein
LGEVDCEVGGLAFALASGRHPRGQHSPYRKISACLRASITQICLSPAIGAFPALERKLTEQRGRNEAVSSHTATLASGRHPRGQHSPYRHISARLRASITQICLGYSKNSEPQKQNAAKRTPRRYPNFTTKSGLRLLARLDPPPSAALIRRLVGLAPAALLLGLLRARPV